MGKYTTINCTREAKKKLNRISAQLVTSLDLERAMPGYLMIELVLEFVEQNLPSFKEYVSKRIKEKINNQD